jgi:hypothetical protein
LGAVKTKGWHMRDQETDTSVGVFETMEFSRLGCGSSCFGRVLFCLLADRMLAFSA